MEIGLEKDPSTRLGDLRFPGEARSRKLTEQELEWFLKALVDEDRDFQRGMLLWLLTAAMISEVARARSDEYTNGVWTILATRAKNSFEHAIALRPWGQSLMRTNSEWIFPVARIDGPRNNSAWYKARDRVLTRMTEIAGHPIEGFTPHDFRRTARSNTKRLKVDFETAEAMLNHVKKGLERTYDRYEMEQEKRLWFLKWEKEITAIAMRAGVTRALGVPQDTERLSMSYSIRLPEGTRVQPDLNLGTSKSGINTKLAKTTAKFQFTWETGRPALA